MYCKHCGKEIADDSAFCQYCGGQLCEQGNIKPNGIPFRWFRSLTKGWQITIMIYMIWFLLSICLWLTDNWRYWFDDDEGWVTEIVVALIIPMVALFIWYYFTHLRKTEKKNVIGDQATTKNIVTNPVQNLKMTSVTLLDFAKQYGKMQVKTVANPATNEVRSYCVFTNGQGIETKVEFGKALGALYPQEIAERKEKLVVVQKLDGSFELEAN